MSEIISPEYNWKQAATQEGVDYAAVQKSFMDQSYGVVANKAKILFQDPFRLGFEIVHRNEKATKMVGIFAFRVNKNLLYAPTFFVNGEIKPADMLYRADVKRFVPLTEDWCGWLVRGVEEKSGETVDKNRFRQSDAYMDRLASPQRVKYASEMDFAMVKAACDELLVDAFGDDNYDLEKVASDNPGIDLLMGMPETWAADMAEARDAFVKSAAFAEGQASEIWKEMLTHCADASPIKMLLPEVINEHGPDAIEKVAAMIGDNDFTARFLAKTYTKDQLETVDGWLAKEASNTGPLPAITIITDPRLAKTAAERETIFDKGYELIDSRPPETLNTVIEEIGDGTVKELSAPGKASILLDDGSLKDVYLFRRDHNLLRDPGVPMSGHDTDSPAGGPEVVYCPKSKQMLVLGYNQELYGDEMIEQGKPDGCCTADRLQDGKCYVALSMETLSVSQIICIEGKEKDGECTNITYCNDWGDESKLFYAPGRSESQGRYVSDETLFLEVKCDVERREECDTVRRIECECDIVPISSSGVSDWCRTAGGVTSSRDVRVKPSKNGLTFDIEHSEDGTILKSARDLGWLEAHLALAEDFSMTTDMAGKILDKAVDKDVTYRVYDTQEKSAYLTRPEGMQDWVQSFDPELQVKLDAPQQQVLSTHTPRRPDQQQRYGDTHQRVPSTPKSGEDALMPMDAVMSKSPEELAQLSEQYDMPHIFDHGAVGQMATTTHNVIDQIKKYVPDLETGVDRYFRILFLLRYRPADFEEHYGKDDLVEFEQDLTDLASQSGEHLLKILQRFEPDQYSAQDN